MSAFEQAFRRTVAWEGGYVNHPSDPGGETNFGISRRAYPHENIAGMTLERAQFLYHRDYWQPCRCEDLPPLIAIELFDAAVNSGVGQAVRWLQRALGVADDGAIGPLTLSAAASSGATAALCARMLGERLAFASSLSTWPSFGRGWARRIAGNLRDIR